MKLPRMYYDDIRPDAFLELHLFDGTIRGVVFRDHDAKAAALAHGRAEIDCTAIQYGLLPRGAVVVTRAVASDTATLLEELRDPGDTGASEPLAATRLSFSLKLLIDKSEHIDEQRDAEVRRADPFTARRYDSIVDALLEASVQDAKDDT